MILSVEKDIQRNKRNIDKLLNTRPLTNTQKVLLKQNENDLYIAEIKNNAFRETVSLCHKPIDIRRIISLLKREMGSITSSVESLFQLMVNLISSIHLLLKNKNL
jgi:hypothetical protein